MIFRIVWITLSFLIITAAALFLIPLIIINLPVDYFSEKEYVSGYKKSTVPKNIFLILIKNILGIILLGIGIILLFIPGQGLLTIFTGLMLINFPGKRRLELYMIRKKFMLNTINWIRNKAGKEDIVIIYSKYK